MKVWQNFIILKKKILKVCNLKYYIKKDCLTTSENSLFFYQLPIFERMVFDF
jgi:hypothetical protein